MLSNKTKSQRSITDLKKAKEKLVQQYELLQIAGETSRFGGWAVDLEDGISIWSDTVSEIHELPKNAPVPLSEAINYYIPEHRQIMAKAFKACAENGTPYDEELQIITHHGRRVWVRTCGRAVKDKEGKVIRVHGSFQDIDEKRKNEEALKASEEHFRRVFESANDGVCVVSLSGEFIKVNHRMCDILGYSRTELESMTIAQVTHPEDRELCSNLVESLITGKSTNHVFEKRYIKKGGGILWVQVSTALLRGKGGEPLHFITHASDITKRRRMEEIKGDVERMMQHDLKTPLGPIIGLTQLLRMDQNLSQEQLSMIKLIENAGQELLRMIDRARDLFKMEMGDYSYAPKPVDVVDVVARLVEQNKTSAFAKSLEYKVILDATPVTKGDQFVLQSDPELLYSMLANLLANAIEASPEDSVIEVCLKRAESKEIAIRNKGAVPKDVRESFFEKYATSGKKNGTGLGTYSAKLIANTMSYELQMKTCDKDDMTEVRIVIP